MKLTKIHSRMLVCGLSLVLLPIASAEDAEEKFEKMDSNGDGKITRVEHAGYAQRMFAEMDADKDRIVTATEMDAIKSDKYQDKDRNELSAAEKIRMLDENGDGRLTAAEHASSSDSLFNKMDTNKDRVLSRQEVRSGHKMLKKDE